MDKEMKEVSYLVYESAQTRLEKIIHRLIIAVLISVMLLFISNAIWVYAWLQYDYIGEEITYQQDGRGLNIIGDGNGVDYGTKSNGQEESTP